MAKPQTDLDALEIVAALSESSALTHSQRDALRAVINLAGAAIVNGWKFQMSKDEDL